MGTTSQIPSVARPIIRTGALNPLLSNRSKVVIILVTIPVTNLTTRNFIRILLGNSGSKPVGLWLQNPCLFLFLSFYLETWSDWPSIPQTVACIFPQNWWHLARSLFVHILIIRLDSNSSHTPTCFWRTGFPFFVPFFFFFKDGRKKIFHKKNFLDENMCLSCLFGYSFMYVFRDSGFHVLSS